MEKHTSIWQKTKISTQNYPQLDKEIKTEIAIVGGGITGLTAATELLGTNKNICIIEAGKIGEGTTGHSTGNLYIPIQSLLSTIASKFNKETVKTIIDSRLYSLNYIERMIKEHEIDCNFLKRTLYIYTNDSKKVKKTANRTRVI